MCLRGNLPFHISQVKIPKFDNGTIVVIATEIKLNNKQIKELVEMNYESEIKIIVNQ